MGCLSGMRNSISRWGMLFWGGWPPMAPPEERIGRNGIAVDENRVVAEPVEKAPQLLRVEVVPSAVADERAGHDGYLVRPRPYLKITARAAVAVAFSNSSPPPQFMIPLCARGTTVRRPAAVLPLADTSASDHFPPGSR
jgi:hypothetical protein